MIHLISRRSVHQYYRALRVHHAYTTRARASKNEAAAHTRDASAAVAEPDFFWPVSRTAACVGSHRMTPKRSNGSGLAGRRTRDGKSASGSWGGEAVHVGGWGPAAPAAAGPHGARAGVGPAVAVAGARGEGRGTARVRRGAARPLLHRSCAGAGGPSAPGCRSGYSDRFE